MFWFCQVVHEKTPDLVRLCLMRKYVFVEDGVVGDNVSVLDGECSGEGRGDDGLGGEAFLVLGIQG